MHRQKAHFVKILLVLLSAFSAGNVAHAACQVEGPSLEETAKYITDAGKTTVPNFSLTYNVQTGLIQLDSGFKQTVPVYLLDCNTFVVGGHPPSIVRVWCKDNVQCVNKVQKTGDPFTEAALHVYYEGDDEHALRVARALSHFVYLLQIQHDETKDPFSTKR
jgi:hypothetical protein